MPCLLVLLALIVPRGTLFFIWLLTDWTKQAFEGWFWPLLGWFFMPWTTLAYMAAMLNNNHQISGGWVVLLVVTMLCDVASWGNKSKSED